MPWIPSVFRPFSWLTFPSAVHAHLDLEAQLQRLIESPHAPQPVRLQRLRRQPFLHVALLAQSNLWIMKQR